MDIYIPNIKLPKDEPGAFKVVVIYVDTDRKLRAGCEGTHEITVVPPHGRLIDADKLIEFIENRYEITWKDDYEGGIKDACVDILEKISTMPTAIQANEDEL